jgi:hypothetical protein
MTELFGRSYALVVGSLQVTDFHFRFRVEKSLKPEPNKCLIEIFNLSPEHRAELAEQAPGKASATKKKGKTASQVTGRVPVRLEAGYGDSIDLIYFGDLRTVDSEISGADWITAIASGDGERAYRTARVNQSVGPKTPLDQTLRAVLKTLGLGEGNLNSVVKALQGGSVTLARGAVLSGPSARVLTDLCRSADLEWSIQDGAPVFVNLNQALAEKAIVLSPSTGLVGSPSVDGTGLMKCKSLIIPGLRCGRVVVVDAASVKGSYRLEKIVYDGDNSGDPWYAELEGRRY